MPSLHADFAELLLILEAEAGAPGSPFGAGDARSVAAVFLEQVLDRKRAHRLLEVLDEAGLLEPEALANAELPELMAAVGEAGLTVTPRVLKPLSKLLLQFSAWAAYGEVSQLSTDRLRDDLTSIPGLGAATADSILLHALGRPVFPVEKSGYRVLARHGWIDPWAGYEEASETVASASDQAPAALSAVSQGLEKVARRFCKVRAPDCQNCPLHPFLPPQGPVEIDA